MQRVGGNFRFFPNLESGSRWLVICEEPPINSVHLKLRLILNQTKILSPLKICWCPSSGLLSLSHPWILEDIERLDYKCKISFSSVRAKTIYAESTILWQGTQEQKWPTPNDAERENRERWRNNFFNLHQLQPGCCQCCWEPVRLLQQLPLRPGC